MFIGGLFFSTNVVAICDTYPCAHASHVLTGVAYGYILKKYEVKTTNILVTGFLLAVAKESLDRHQGKTFNAKDVATRFAGIPIGIYIAKEF